MAAAGRGQEAVRERLLTAAEELTAGGEGLGDVSVERLANAAGISRATFYIHFADKGDLLGARFEQIVDDLFAAGQPWWRLESGASRSDLRAALGELATAYRSSANLIDAVYDEAAYDPDLRELIARLVDGGIEALRTHIERGQRGGFVDPELLTPETASWLGWMVERGLRNIAGPAPGDELDALLEAQTDLIWSTLYDF